MLCPGECVEREYVHSQGSVRLLSTSPPFPWSFASVVSTTPPSNLLILVSTVREAHTVVCLDGSPSSCGHSSGGDGPSLLYAQVNMPGPDPHYWTGPAEMRASWSTPSTQMGFLSHPLTSQQTQAGAPLENKGRETWLPFQSLMS